MRHPAAFLCNHRINRNETGSKKGRRDRKGSRLPSCNWLAYFSQPEQEAQHSAEAQHDALAAFTAPAKVSAITASNRIAFIFFMDFSPLKNRVGSCEPMARPSARNHDRLLVGISKCEAGGF
jgi:hypothetical protein